MREEIPVCETAAKVAISPQRVRVGREVGRDEWIVGVILQTALVVAAAHGGPDARWAVGIRSMIHSYDIRSMLLYARSLRAS